MNSAKNMKLKKLMVATAASEARTMPHPDRPAVVEVGR
jgi:hypothetical protein